MRTTATRDTGERVTRYVVTYVNKRGLRTLIGSAQGRHTYATEGEAVQALYNLRTNNSPFVLREVYGADTFEVRPCECWPVHFDPVSIYFD